MPGRRLCALHPVAFVTGASGGLGQAFCEMLLAEGIRVWGTARDATRLTNLAASPRFTPVVLDLDQPTAALEAFQSAQTAAGGRFDLVVQNAGYGVFGPFASLDSELWQRQLSALLLTTARLSHAALGPMLACGHGSLVHVSSLAAELPLPFMAGYNVAKAGLSALSESLIFETRRTGITVIDFRPGDYRTAFNQAMPATGVTTTDPRLARVWQRLEHNLRTAPRPAQAAADLRRALLRRRPGIVRSGSFFQARLAPFFAALAPAALLRAASAHYFKAS